MSSEPTASPAQDGGFSILIEALEARRRQLRQELDALHDRMRSIESQIRDLADQEQTISHQIGGMQVQVMRLRGSVDWAFLLAVDEYGNTPKPVREEADAQLRALAAVGRHESLAFSGYRPDVQQRTLQIRLVRDCDRVTAAAHRALEQLLPYLARSPWQGGGCAVVDVLDSQCEGFKLLLCPEKSYFAVRLARYGVSTIKWKSATLAELLAYAQENLYYARRLGD
jgi:hypothetical protein